MTSPINWDYYFRYDPSTGRLYWRVTNSNRAVAGSEVAAVRNWGYVGVRLHGKTYQAHRVIWDMMNPGDKLEPGDEIDHIDHNRENNLLANLRKTSRKENSRNLSLARNNTSGTTGVRFDKSRSKWRAEIKVKKQVIHLGRFDTIEEAVTARKEAERKYGFHENHGK